MRRWVTSISVAVTLAAGLLAGAPAASGAPSYLFEVSARGGRISGIGADTGKERLTLTLSGVADFASRFSDRPLRKAYVVSTAELVRGWSRWFAASSPNAILSYTLPKDSLPHNAVFVLSKPRYDRAKRTLTFEARHLHRAVELSTEAKQALRDQPLWRAPARFASASLFIDNAYGGGCTVGTFIPYPATNCAGADLSGLQAPNGSLPFSTLTGTNFTAANLSGASFDGSDLSNANLSAANLTSASFDNATLVHADFRGADLTGVEFMAANLTGAGFAGATLMRADFTFANLSNADLSGQVLEYFTIRGANLTGANLTGANFNVADLTAVTLHNANLSNANFVLVDLRNMDLSGANLTGANLSGANLAGANLSGANLTNANLTLAHLDIANLAGATGTGTNLSGATINSAIFDGSTLTAGTWVTGAACAVMLPGSC